MMVRWSGEVQVNVNGMSNLNLSLTLVDVKLVITNNGSTPRPALGVVKVTSFIQDVILEVCYIKVEIRLFRAFSVSCSPGLDSSQHSLASSQTS